jgi:hypothetical protein
MCIGYGVDDCPVRLFIFALWRVLAFAWLGHARITILVRF